MIELRQTKVYNRWSYGLRDWQAKVRINVRIQRLFLTNPGDVRAGGEGISEPRINYGPGYRVYFIRQERSITILLAAGDKDCGQLDIAITMELARNLQENNQGQD